VRFSYCLIPCCTGTYWYVPVCTDLPNPVQVYRTRIPDDHIVPDIGFNIGIYRYREIMSRYRVWQGSRCCPCGVSAPGPGPARVSGFLNLRKPEPNPAGGPLRGSFQSPWWPASERQRLLFAGFQGQHMIVYEKWNAENIIPPRAVKLK
jgi:hypothetical protein